MKKSSSVKLILASLALTAGVLSAPPAFAYWGHGGDHIGISLGFGYNPYYGGYYGPPGYYGYPAYYAPPPTVVYAPAPQVVYAQPAPVYTQPTYAQPAPAQASPPAGNSAYPGYMGQ